MATFNKGEYKAERKAVKVVRDYLVSDDYDGAALAFYKAVFNLDDPDRMQAAYKRYMQTYHKRDKAGEYVRSARTGEMLADFGGLYNRRWSAAIAEINGNGDFGGLLYTMAAWLDTAARQAAFAQCLADVATPAPEAPKPILHKSKSKVVAATV